MSNSSAFKTFSDCKNLRYWAGANCPGELSSQVFSSNDYTFELSETDGKQFYYLTAKSDEPDDTTILPILLKVITTKKNLALDLTGYSECAPEALKGLESQITSLTINNLKFKEQDLTLADLFGTNAINNTLETLIVNDTVRDGAFENFVALENVTLKALRDKQTLGALFGFRPVNSNTSKVQQGGSRNITSRISYQIPNSLTAFTLEHLTLSEEDEPLPTIPAFAFCNTDLLSDLKIENNELDISEVTSISDYAFYNSHCLPDKVTLSESLESIGQYAFSEIDNIEAILIQSDNTSVDEHAFKDFKGVIFSTLSEKTDTWSESWNSSSCKVVWNFKGDLLTDIGGVNGTPGLKWALDADDEIIIYDYTGEATEIEIPSVIKINNKDCLVTAINSDAFINQHITKITIPHTVTSIGERAFFNCRELKQFIVLKEETNNLEFGADVFGNSSDTYCPLTDVVAPVSIINCLPKGSDSLLENITLIDGSEIIGSAFKDCSKLGIVTLPDTLTTIGSEAFSGCSKLMKINSNNTQSNRSNIPSITLPYGLESIGESAFNGLSTIKTVSIPTTVNSIGEDAFSGCTSLEEITLPFIGETLQQTDGVFGHLFGQVPENEEGGVTQGSVKYNIPNTIKNVQITKQTAIPDNSFYGCSFLQSITIPETTKSIGSGAFYGCAGLSKLNSDNEGFVNIPEAITTISPATFYGCTSFTSIIIPDSVTVIGDEAFRGCEGLTSVTIPDSVTSIGYDAFHFCVNLASVYITAIATWCNIDFARAGANPLCYAENLYLNGELVTDLVIPEGVTNIKNYAFCNYESLKSVTIGNSVTTIGVSVFDDCTSLTSVEIGDSVTSIGTHAFSGCSSLESITLPFVGNTLAGDENTHFGYIFGAYSYSYNNACVPTSLKTVVITGGTKIDAYAFSDCSNLTSVIIPDSIKTIGDSAFSGCSSLESITLPFVEVQYNEQTLTSFGSLFGTDNENVPKSLTTVTITGGQGDTKLAANSFNNCQSLKKVIIQDNVSEIAWGAFAGCSVEDFTLPFVGRSKNEQFDTYFGYILGIKNRDALEGETPESLYYPKVQTVKSVKVCGDTIASEAFRGCVALQQVEINTSSIYSKVFIDCNSLKSVIIGDSVTSIGSKAFYECKSLTSVIINNGVTSIGVSAFAYCTSLTNIEIPDSVTSIGYMAFWDCTSLESISLPFVGATKNGTENTHFGYIFGASQYFYNDDHVPTRLKTVIITGGSTIGEEAFWDCNRLTSVVIGDSVTRVGSDAFAYCDSLTSVNYLGTIEQWCNISFEGYNSNPLYYAKNLYLNGNLVTDLVIPGTVTEIKKYAFRNCTSLTSVKIPDSVETFGVSVFSGCSNLSVVTLGNALRDISNSAFYGCSSLASITIGNSVTSIGDSAFSGCGALENVEVKSTKISDIGANAFANCSLLTNIEDFINETVLTHVGAGAFFATAYYKNKSNWLYCGSTNNVTDPSTISKNKGDTLIVGNWLLAVVAQDIYKSEYDYKPTKASKWSLDNIASENLPKTLHIADNAFAGLNNLYTIILPGSHHIHRSIHHYQCDESNILNIIYNNNGFCTTEVEGEFDQTGTYIPNYCGGPLAPCECLSIGANAFKNCYNLGSIYIPAYVQNIGQNAFDECGYFFDQYREIVTECLCGENGEWCGSYIYDYELEQQANNRTTIYYANDDWRWESITNGMGTSKRIQGADAKPDMSLDNNGTNWALATILSSPDGNINTNIYSVPEDV